ncbi:MAG: GntR family transcriptional regulator [Candidatus Riflebacteria bacterium]|nr:GntR family transcriptional regulator [Candidatus Riflebacteria bacterium]
MITINESSGVPIYLQVVEGLRCEILGGVYGPDDRLPSIRELAVGLTLNPNTVARAYQELETLGVIYFKRGQGAFVAPHTKEERMREATKEIIVKVRELIESALRLGLSRDSLRDIFQECLGSKPEKHGQPNDRINRD